MKVSEREFEAIVEDALGKLPEQFRNELENIELMVQDVPDTSDLEHIDTDDPHSLLGLYSGIPLTERGTWYGMTPVTPDRIKIFQKNIERICSNKRELKEQILITVFHEIGHYFGMDEDEIRDAMEDYL